MKIALPQPILLPRNFLIPAIFGVLTLDLNLSVAQPISNTLPCSAEAKPVCGSDGKSYLNDCSAKMVGTTVAKAGACTIAQPERVNKSAPDSPAPAVCPMVYAPVCGKDGRTYSNSCVAQASTVAVDHQGECIR